jgi:hypothetical protein
MAHPVTTTTAAGRIEEEVRCAVAKAKEMPGHDVGMTIDATGVNVYLMVRWSRAPLYAYRRTEGAEMSIPEKCMSIDIVQIGWSPWVFDAVPISQKPKGTAQPIFDALKQIARETGRILKAECIHDRTGRITRRLRALGFGPMPYYDDCMAYVPESMPVYTSDDE